MTEPTVLDTQAIMKRIPHRAPFLLIDRVLDIEAGKSVTAVKNVTFHEEYFQGHFPEHPVMPGVLIVEAVAQACGVLAWETARSDEPDIYILYLVGIEKARFKRPVRPGDQLLLTAGLVNRKRGLWRFEGRAEVDGALVAQVELLLAGGKPL